MKITFGEPVADGKKIKLVRMEPENVADEEILQQLTNDGFLLGFEGAAPHAVTVALVAGNSLPKA